MPKMSGQKITRAPARPQPASRPIMSFAPPTPAPPPPNHKPPPASNDLAAETIRKAKNPGSIDPKQRHY
jgi:hypothetical protein